MGEIRTGRLVLREYREGDVARIVELANNMNIAISMVGAFPHPYTVEDAEKWVKFASSPEERDKNFVIIFEGEIVGGMGFKFKSGSREGTVDARYWLGEDYWGKGFGTEAFGAMVDYIFENYDVRRIDIGIFERNVASAAVLKKCGFVMEGCLKNSLISFGKVCDECWYGILRGEWEVLNDKID